jgi:hypothetical protein
MQQVKSFGIFQTAKVFAALYFIMTAIFAIPIAVIGAIGGILAGKPTGLLFLLLLAAPFFYAAIGWLFGALACWLYNTIAAQIGGIEIELG